MHIQYPKLIPENQISSIVDENGFSATERIALQNAWRVIKRSFRSFALELFLNFFTSNENLLNRFRLENGKFNSHALNRHSLSVLYAYQHIIEVGLNQPRQINLFLTELNRFHSEKEVIADEIELLSTAVNKHILSKLKEISSPTLEIAFEKITKLMLSFSGEIV